MKKQALGRGLGALIETNDIKTDGGSMINEIDIEFIAPNPNQPRSHFDEEQLQELADSITENGIISPITLRQIDSEHYQIIAGERRFRASKIAGLTKIPAYIRPVNDEQMQVMALIENVQRTDLNAIETALGYNKLMTDYNLTQERLSEKIGKKRATIANYLRLLKLPAEIQIGIQNEKIEMGHARAVAGVESAAEQLKIYETIVKNGLSVRKTEELVKSYQEGNVVENLPKTRTKKIVIEEYRKLKDELSRLFHSNVQLAYSENGKGKITIPFDSDDDMMRIMSILDKLK
jgi:ParB family chromosome partitioning protein